MLLGVEGIEHVNREKTMGPNATYGVLTTALVLVAVEFVGSLQSSNTRNLSWSNQGRRSDPFIIEKSSILPV